MNASTRRLIAAIHRWSGLVIGLLVAVLALTGAAMAWRPQLDPLLNRDLNAVGQCASPLPLDELVAQAKTAHPGVPVALLRIEPGVPKAAVVRFRDSDEVFLDPCSGRSLGEQDRYGGLLGHLEQLHKLAYWTRSDWNRLIPNVPTNTLITGTVAALFATLLIIGGLILWWPRHRHLRAWRFAVTIDGRLKGRAFDYKLHSTVGFWISLIALTSATTGMTWAFNWPETVLASLTASPMQVTKFSSAAPSKKDTPRLSMEASWVKAQAVMPDISRALISEPEKANDPVRIRAVERSSPHGEAFSILYLDAYRGDVLSFQPYTSLGMGTKLYYWARAIHTGRAGGVLVQLLLTIGALGILTSIYAGFSSYFRKVLIRSRSASSAPAVPRKLSIELENGPGE
jgi:uncharacterized iron-regulated membrane protein